jgi:hypothetical protein
MTNGCWTLPSVSFWQWGYFKWHDLQWWFLLWRWRSRPIYAHSLEPRSSKPGGAHASIYGHEIIASTPVSLRCWATLVGAQVVAALAALGDDPASAPLAHAGSGRTLLLDAINIWATNVVIFVLWFWALDRGGPAARGLVSERKSDFLFTQQQTTVDREQFPNWSPVLSMIYFWRSQTPLHFHRPTRFR